jgi:putative FmdB family regulatory protein
MPIYEYKCSECEAHFEKLQKSSDEPLKVCGQCGGQLEKQWSLSGFQFKGEGWYVTDYAGKKSDPQAEKTDPAENKSKPDSTTGGESASKKSTEKKDSVKKETKKE